MVRQATRWTVSGLVTPRAGWRPDWLPMGLWAATRPGFPAHLPVYELTPDKIQPAPAPAHERPATAGEG